MRGRRLTGNSISYRHVYLRRRLSAQTDEAVFSLGTLAVGPSDRRCASLSALRPKFNPGEKGVVLPQRRVPRGPNGHVASATHQKARSPAISGTSDWDETTFHCLSACLSRALQLQACPTRSKWDDESLWTTLLGIYVPANRRPSWPGLTRLDPAIHAGSAPFADRFLSTAACVPFARCTSGESAWKPLAGLIERRHIG
jgi:hypothetical protein